MASLLLGSDLPAARDLVTAVQARSDGIPLHVEEILALHGDAVTTDDHPTELPASVEDAIVVRLESRSAEAIAVARAGAVIGRSCDLGLIAAVTDRPLEDLAAPLAELADHFILLPSRVPGRYVFRHALICDVIYDHIAEPERRRLHDRTAQAGAGRAELGGDAFLAIHLERAGRLAEAFETAVSAARVASSMSAHREALRAVRGRTADDARRPGALRPRNAPRRVRGHVRRHGRQRRRRPGIRRRAIRLPGGWHSIQAATVLASRVTVRHLLGDDLATREAMLHAGLDELDGLEASGAAKADELDRPRASSWRRWRQRTCSTDGSTVHRCRHRREGSSPRRRGRSASSVTRDHPRVVLRLRGSDGRGMGAAGCRGRRSARPLAGRRTPPAPTG